MGRQRRAAASGLLTSAPRQQCAHARPGSGRRTVWNATLSGRKLWWPATCSATWDLYHSLILIAAMLAAIANAAILASAITKIAGPDELSSPGETVDIFLTIKSPLIMIQCLVIAATALAHLITGNAPWDMVKEAIIEHREKLRQRELKDAAVGPHAMEGAEDNLREVHDLCRRQKKDIKWPHEKYASDLAVNNEVNLIYRFRDGRCVVSVYDKAAEEARLFRVREKFLRANYETFPSACRDLARRTVDEFDDERFAKEEEAKRRTARGVEGRWRQQRRARRERRKRGRAPRHGGRVRRRPVGRHLAHRAGGAAQGEQGHPPKKRRPSASWCGRSRRTRPRSTRNGSRGAASRRCNK